MSTPTEQSPQPGAASGRLRPFGARPSLTFALVIALPTLLLYAASVVLVVFVLGTMARDIDRLESARGVTGMHAALDTLLNDLANAVADEGTWDEAYLNVVVNSNPAWMDSTWGTTARLGQSYDNVLVTDQDGNIVFGENAVGSLTGNIASHFPSARTMLAQLGRGIAATGDATTVSQFAADKQGVAGLAAVSIHKSSTTGFAVPAQSRQILWISRHMTPALLQDIAGRYQIALPSLVAGKANPGQAFIDLADADGRAIGAIVWAPDRPGNAALTRALLIAAGIFAAIGLAMIIGLVLIWRAILRRAAVAETAVGTAAVVETPATAPAAAEPDDVVVVAADAEDASLSLVDTIAATDFEIEYQPVFDLRAETLIGAEALLRWKRPDKSLLLQETLTPAQNAALLERIGIMAVRRATDEMAPLLGMLLSIAVGSVQLMSPVFAEKVAGTLAATNFPGRRLQLVLNAARLPPPDELQGAIANIGVSGVTVGFGDFVLGPQTIAYARPGFAQRVRLPEAMVHDVAGDQARFALVEATIGVAGSAGWAVTAPFLERREDAAKLLRLGCREFQGPLLAPPMPIAALTALILNTGQKKAS